jgi:hypothetical protein
LNSFIDSSENPASNGNVEKRRLDRDLAVGDHDLADLGGKLSD